jgi:hypothetical protein
LEADLVELSRLEELAEQIGFDEEVEIPDVLRPEVLIGALLESCPEAWRIALQNFLADDKQIKPTHHQSDQSSTLEMRYRKLVDAEFAISDENKHHLIRPSGNLPAPILLKLHYFYLEDGETADLTSLYPRLLLSAGFSDQNAFWMQAYYRRQTPGSTRKSPMTQWTALLRRVHEDLASWLEKAVQGSIHVLFGHYNRLSDHSSNAVKFDARVQQSV